MRKLYCSLFLAMLFALLFLNISAKADCSLSGCSLIIDGIPSEQIRAGSVSVKLSVTSDEVYSNLMIWGAVYSSDQILESVNMREISLNEGANQLIIDGITATEESTHYCVMIWDIENLAPIMDVYDSEIAEEFPTIESLSVFIEGNGTVSEYRGLINEEAKTVDIEIPLYYNNNGEVLEVYLKNKTICPIGADEFKTTIENLTPVITCPDGVSVVDENVSRDFSEPVMITVCNEMGVSSTYTVNIFAETVQRWIDFNSTSYTLTNTTSQFGADTAARQGTPTSGGTKLGSGIWKQNGFAWKQNADGECIDSNGNVIDISAGEIKTYDMNGLYSRSDDSAGYFEVNRDSSGKTAYGLRMVKDRIGDFSLYSAEGGTPTYKFNRSYIETEFKIEEMSGSGLDICFGQNRFVMRAIPSDENKIRILFGSGEDSSFSGVDTGISIDYNQKYNIKCITDSGDDFAVGTLYLDNICIANAEIIPTKLYKLQSEHTKYMPLYDTYCSIVLYNWRMHYIAEEIPEFANNLYNEVVEEEKEIWRWIATMYDGSGTIEYDSVVNTNNLKYDSMNYITGGSGNGFFYAPSSKANTDIFCAEIESTGQVLSNMGSVGLSKYMPQNIRDRFYQFFNSRYIDDSDAKFGAGYYDTLYKDSVNARGHSRNQSNALNMRRVNDSAVSTYKTSTEAVIGPLANHDDPTVILNLMALDSTVLCQSAEEDDTAVQTSQWEPLTTEGQADAQNMVEAINAGVDAFRNWVTYLNWSGHSWTAGDVLGNTPLYIEKLDVSEEKKAEYYHAALDVLLEKQDGETGVWPEGGTKLDSEGIGSFGIDISGVYKICNFIAKIPANVLDTYQPWLDAGLDSVNYIPKAQEIYDYIIKNLVYYSYIDNKELLYKYYTDEDYERIVGDYQTNRMTNILMIRNTLDVIIYIKNMIDECRLYDDMGFIIEFSFDNMKKYRIDNQPGVYSSSITYDSNGQIGSYFSGASTGMGYYQGLGEHEPCINTCTSITKLYTMLNTFYGTLIRPQFDAEFAAEFYQILQNELDTQYWSNEYKKLYLIDYTFADDFENKENGSMEDSDHFKHSIKNGSTAEIITAPQKDGTEGKILMFDYDGTGMTEGGGAYIELYNKYYSIMNNIESSTVSFDLKIDGDFSPKKHTVYFGFYSAALFSLYGNNNSTFSILNRTSQNVDLTSLGSISADNWYRVKLEYMPEAEEKLKLYIDSNLIYSGNDFYGSGISGTAPPSATRKFVLYYYRAAKATLYIDNLNIEMKKIAD